MDKLPAHTTAAFSSVLGCTTPQHYKRAVAEFYPELSVAGEGEMGMSTSMLGTSHQHTTCLEKHTSLPCQTPQQVLSTYSRTLLAGRAGLVLHSAGPKPIH